ncbi:MAG: hypothetical protein UY48_C0003G0098 [Candidatus Gottesmanbacteria bacterium GW2011_GWB1_49_7]|uniref:Methyltransferase type 11 domain-containing protein n=1 Tax=Candidatus Gottesmanbacteria bacterium GW2011_GWB1_49_7 TaxID=1618448 RepID=A0A0G1W3E2_9BACT|nr:MAG: hypothetical protein UY48_C0003G0098 [Candidatus Gottesmanbacteria bacterium GW2011_GWB1_49_7]
MPVVDVVSGQEYILEHFPEGYDYRKPKEPHRLDYSRKDNLIGYWQRAVDVFWAMEMCVKSGSIGISLGSAGVPCPGCLTTDVRVGLPAHYPETMPVAERSLLQGHIRLDAGENTPYFMRHDSICNDDHPTYGLGIFPDGVFSLVLANHVVEHIAAPLEQTLESWGRLLRSGGVMALVVPEHCPPRMDVFKIDPDHKHAWTAEQFLVEAQRVTSLEVIEHKLQDTRFSFVTVLRKR